MTPGQAPGADGGVPDGVGAADWVLRLAGGLLLAILWEASGRISSSLLLPSFTETVAALAQLMTGGELWRALWISNQALLLGFTAALVTGVAAGVALAASPRLAPWLDPYLHLLLVVPTTALVPIVFMATGPGLATRSVVVGIFATPIVAQCVRTAVEQVDPRLVDLARSLCASRLQTWRRVMLPASAPGLAVAARLGLARAVEGMVVVELLLVAVGVGGLLLDYQGRFDSAHVYAVILVVMAESSVLSHAARRLERRIAIRSRA